MDFWWIPVPSGERHSLFLLPVSAAMEQITRGYHPISYPIKPPFSYGFPMVFLFPMVKNVVGFRSSHPFVTPAFRSQGRPRPSTPLDVGGKQHGAPKLNPYPRPAVLVGSSFKLATGIIHWMTRHITCYAIEFRVYWEQVE